eukprot:TRINITY_DN3125_c0_g1_i3.p2 TRINITY_DN3125_c0_g1~~TRINITY_DN3125_c0_g1_i3.p2  ORF type:complete len:310 (+),score=44.47 TRINITY_DN3125_c0_g1_i3:1253-2182(+)
MLSLVKPSPCLLLQPNELRRFYSTNNNLRHNPVTNEWVAFASGRSGRPNQFQPKRQKEKPTVPSKVDDCPFCVGNEKITGETLLQYPSQESSGWSLRVVNNKYPVVQHPSSRHEDDTLQLHALKSFIPSRLNAQLPAFGHHEVVIESPKHDSRIATSSVESLTQLLRAFHSRGQHISKDPIVKHLLYFKNQGKKAGASLLHPHAQIVGLPIVTSNVQDRIEHAHRYFQRNGRCVVCDLNKEEMTSNERIVSSNSDFIAFVPYAANTPFQTWIVPRKHRDNFLQSDSSELHSLSSILLDVFKRLARGLNE